ncbi:putative serine proteinase, precursor [Cladochytrium replicatum]|nr:putative serine proteinase, precursor [Cladochytrium replicatum]
MNKHRLWTILSLLIYVLSTTMLVVASPKRASHSSQSTTSSQSKSPRKSVTVKTMGQEDMKWATMLLDSTYHKFNMLKPPDGGASTIPSSYIVSFKDGVDTDSIINHSLWINGLMEDENKQRRLKRRQSDANDTVPSDTQPSAQAHIHCVFTFGYGAVLSYELVQKVSARAEVAEVEADPVIRTRSVWGLDRINQRNLPLDNNAKSDNIKGGGVDIYVLDSGILTTHSEFGNRATFGATFSSSGTQDGAGHGTHVAATAAGRTFGVAPGANLIAVKVIDNDGSGSGSAVIMGIQWTIKNVQKTRRPSVINMSIGGSKSNALDRAVLQAIAQGISVVTAAGNDNRDACLDSPGNQNAVITVAASSETDAKAPFSNDGSCVKLFGPGVGITSAWIGSNTATNTLDGTSMASPHVAGSAALLLGNNPNLKPAQVLSLLVSASTPSKISGTLAGAPNKLLYTGPAGFVTSIVNGGSATAGDNSGINSGTQGGAGLNTGLTSSAQKARIITVDLWATMLLSFSLLAGRQWRCTLLSFS